MILLSMPQWTLIWKIVSQECVWPEAYLKWNNGDMCQNGLFCYLKHFYKSPNGKIMIFLVLKSRSSLVRKSRVIRSSLLHFLRSQGRVKMTHFSHLRTQVKMSSKMKSKWKLYCFSYLEEEFKNSAFLDLGQMQ
jgi:hypothetical protein